MYGILLSALNTILGFVVRSIIVKEPLLKSPAKITSHQGREIKNEKIWAAKFFRCGARIKEKTNAS